jgi:hypothetical protein
MNVGVTAFLCLGATTTIGISLMIILTHFPCRTRVDVFSFLMAKVALIITVIKILQYAPLVIDESICYGVSVTVAVLHGVHTAFVLLVINASLREPDQFIQFMIPSIAVIIPMGVLYNQSWYVGGQCLDKPFGTSLALILYVIFAIYYVERRIWKMTATFVVSVLGILAFGAFLKYETSVVIHVLFMPCLFLQMCIGMYTAVLFGSFAPTALEPRSSVTSVSVVRSEEVSDLEEQGSRPSTASSV